MTEPGQRPILCAIHQPHYLPWLRYLDKIARADVFVLLDDVQYSKNGWQNRNRIKGPRGPFLLTVPVRHGHRAALPEVEIAGQGWRRAHLNALRTSYGRSPGFELLYPPVERLLAREWTSLVELNAALLEILLDLLGIRTPVKRSSRWPVPATATERLAHLVRAAGATHYLSGAHATSAYLDPEALARSGVGLAVHEWRSPVYPQAHPGAGFVPDLAIVDLIAAVGKAACEVLATGGRVRFAAPAPPPPPDAAP